MTEVVQGPLPTEVVHLRVRRASVGNVVAVVGAGVAGGVSLSPLLFLVAYEFSFAAAVGVLAVWLALGAAACIRWPSNRIAEAFGTRTPDPESEFVVLRHALARACNPAAVDPESIILRIAPGRLNAFSAGRDVIAMTADLVDGSHVVDVTQIEALLAHELAHHRHGDTFLGGAGWWFRLPLVGLDWVSRVARRVPLIGGLIAIAIAAPFLAVLWPVHVAWHAASVPREFLADRFAVDCGYGVPLERFFTGLARHEQNYWRSGLSDVVNASHPPLADRIARIQDAVVDEIDTYRLAPGASL